MSDILLSREEIDELCAPIRQPAAQLRKLQAMGIRCWARARPPAGVVVARSAYEAWKNPPPPPTPAPAPWVPPPPTPWEETPLGRWQAEQRVYRAQAEATEAQQKASHDAYMEATRQEREDARRVQRAALVRFHANRRRVVKLQRTPQWADEDAIRAIYLEAQRLTETTGVPHHVDHEIPLQGKLVCGLHVHNNLQILTGSENSRKRNKYEIAP